MTEDDARDWLISKFGGAALTMLERYTALLLAESDRQSLIAKSTFDKVWSRHIADSAQLVCLARAVGEWLDVGSGGGLPGMVVAILRADLMVLVEPRRKRAEFLTCVAAELGLTNLTVLQASAQAANGQPVVISARAVTSLADLFVWTAHLVSRETQYLLPRGANAACDLENVIKAWQGQFHVEQSLTDRNAGIVVATNVRRR